MEWQPIETAPKDGTVVLAYGRGEYGPADYVVPDGWPETPQLVRWGKTEFAPQGAWVTQKVSLRTEFGSTVTEGVLFEATHWVPLPEAPRDSDRYREADETRSGSVPEGDRARA